MAPKLIVALDFDNAKEALELVDKLEPCMCSLKVGSEMFTLLGAQFVSRIIAKGFKVFLDLKFHDIPNTVANACKRAAELGVWMVNVHASGGQAMMVAARQAIEPFGADRPLLIAVTVLTSFSESDLLSIGVTNSLENQVQKLAIMTQNAGLDGVVSSAHEVQSIKQSCGRDFLVVTPGIRPQNTQKNDQTRTMTPQCAIILGSDFIVVGRPITKAPDPASVVQEINNSIIL